MWPENESSNKKKLDILSKIPMRSTGEPADIAKTVYFLLEQSPYITGQNINVDGGRRLNMWFQVIAEIKNRLIVNPLVTGILSVRK